MSFFTELLARFKPAPADKATPPPASVPATPPQPEHDHGSTEPPAVVEAHVADAHSAPGGGTG